MSSRKECLERAMDIVCKDRDDTYGKPENNFNVIAELWTAYKRVDFTALDVAVMMNLLKVARVKNGRFKEDNFIDMAGYAACACEIGAKTCGNEL